MNGVSSEIRRRASIAMYQLVCRPLVLHQCLDLSNRLAIACKARNDLVQVVDSEEFGKNKALVRR